MYTIQVDHLDKTIGEKMDNVTSIVAGQTRYDRNIDAEQLFQNVFGVRPAVFTNNMYHDCGDIVSEHGTMLVYVGTRMIKMNGGDNIFMDVQGQ
ncbi:hypothetical protein phiAS5_ORF0297 [Aeromonas phage phiAS5]|uniref:Uncharacterized protein n=1 Tax=Aeromonas phage phiAS5 TaxID=879630 RepID=E1A251_9CAUD|nr:hypothetical protein phiAS5_ORF0297 [Aeromonas phage phiAS5]ADM80140.1 hypothetical protein phiAS5_ORF0297 [Aeromonas phage phiAS5]BES53098.1 hypothetical protein [Aeromonas phage phiWae14]